MYVTKSKSVTCPDKSLFAPCEYKSATCGQISAPCERISARCEQTVGKGRRSDASMICRERKLTRWPVISLAWNELIVVITTLFEVDSDDVASAGFYLIFNIKFIVFLSKPFQKRGFMMTIKCNEKFCSLIRNKPGHVDGISFILPLVETSSPANGIAACIRLFLYIVLLLGG